MGDVALHRPLASVPENTLKFAVGVLLSGFGIFWVGEGAGFVWPGGDWSLPALVAGFLAVSLAAVPLCRSRSARPVLREDAMSWMKTAAAELLGLFVDDGVFALAILALILGVGLLLPRLGLPPGLGGPLRAIGLAVALLASVLRAARR